MGDFNSIEVSDLFSKLLPFLIVPGVIGGHCVTQFMQDSLFDGLPSIYYAIYRNPKVKRGRIAVYTTIAIPAKASAEVDFL
jgi:hypothetical protein